MLKIAIPTTDGGEVDNHFGHCAQYTIVTIENNTVVDKTTLPSPQGCGCKSNIAYELHEMGVSLMLAGNMGEGAYNKLTSNSIEVIRGVQGPIDMVVMSYLAGLIRDVDTSCNHECHTH